MSKMNKFDYDTWALEIIQRKNRDAILAWKAQQLELLVPRGMELTSALEIGCAEGYVIHHIKERFAIKECYGTDVAREFLSRARQLFPDISFMQTTGPALPFPDRSLDLVVLSDLMEHVEDINALISEIQRIGKYMLVKVPIEKYLWRSVISKPLGRSPRVGYGHPDGHLREYTKREWLSLFRREGFKIIGSRVIYSADSDPPGMKNRIIRFRWFLDRTLKKYFPHLAHLFFGGHLIAFLDNCGGASYSL